jgi:hypothetical protein
LKPHHLQETDVIDRHKRLGVYLREHRRLAVLARRFKFMRQSDGAVLLAQRAEAAAALAMLEVDEIAREARR